VPYADPEKRREKAREASRAWNRRHPEKRRAASAAYRERNLEKEHARNRKYAKDNQEKRTAYSRDWLARNPEKRAAYRQRQGEPDALEKRRQRENERYQNDPEWRQKRKQQVREKYRSDPEKARQRNRESYDRNPENNRQVSRDYRKRNPEYVKRRGQKRNRELKDSIPAPRTWKRWTPDEDAVVVMRDDITLIEMAYLLGRSLGGVRGRRARLKDPEGYAAYHQAHRKRNREKNVAYQRNRRRPDHGK
jgi:hypothetical protein